MYLNAQSAKCVECRSHNSSCFKMSRACQYLNTLHLQITFFRNKLPRCNIGDAMQSQLFPKISKNLKIRFDQFHRSSQSGIFCILTFQQEYFNRDRLQIFLIILVYSESGLKITF